MMKLDSKRVWLGVLLAVSTSAWAATTPAAAPPASHKPHAALAGAGTVKVPTPQSLPRFNFENYTTANGLPDNHVFTVLVDGDRVWAGTENGLALYQNHTWKTYTTKDGLAHRAVLSLALDHKTGDLWAGTMGGLSRVSGGRIESYNQLNSGLSNDVVIPNLLG